MRRRKPQAGVCGRCGRAVIQPNPGELSVVRNRDGVWISGHHYVLGELDLVRCFEHEPEENQTGWDVMPLDGSGWPRG